MKKIFFILLSLFANEVILSQIANTYFSDIEQKEGGSVIHHLKYQNTFILGGTSFEKKPMFPSIIRIDTLGNVIWNTSINDLSTYGNPNPYLYNLLDGNDGFIYAYWSNIVTSGFSCTEELWKIDVTSGVIVWKKPFNNCASGGTPTFITYDANNLLLFNPRKGNVFGRIAMISRVTGDTLYTYKVVSYNSQYDQGLTIDNQKNIYVTRDDTVLKLSASFPHNVIWKKSYATSIQIESYQGLYCDTITNELYCMGNGNVSSYLRGKVIKANSSNGTVISTYAIPSTATDVRMHDFKFNNGFLYINWRHMYVGGGVFPYTITKYNMTSGNATWNTIYSFTGVGLPASGSHSGAGSSALSIDIDNNADVYATGYYGDANYGPESWGIIKINGSNGNVNYEKTITEDSAHYNNLSTGIGVSIINNQPYFTGNIQTYHTYNYERSKIALVKLDPTSGNTVLKKYIGGTFQFPSKVLTIENYSGNQTLVLKQTGRMLEMEMYSFSKALLWKKTIARHYFLFGSNVEIDPIGQIYLTAYSKGSSVTAPFYGTNTDSIHIFKINSVGSIINEASFYVGLSNVYPVSISTDNTSALLFYQKSSVIYYRKFTTSLTAEYNSQVNVSAIGTITPPFANIILKSKYCFNKNANTVGFFGLNSGLCKLVEINKTAMTQSIVATVPGYSILNLNNLYEVDANNVLLSGRNAPGYESLAMYNTTIKDTVWKKNYATAMVSNALKVAMNPAKSSIYSVSSNSNNIVVRKFSPANGSQVWSYTYNCNAGSQEGFPLDVSYDEYRNQLLICGFKTISNKRQALILVLDTLGNALDTIIKTGSVLGNNEALCSKVLPDGTQWVGGYVNNNPFSGFITEVTPSLTSAIWPGDANSDGLADNLDVLELGLHYTQTGAPRASTSNAWQSFFANNWIGTITSGKNLNHSDCNGDGTINNDDTLAIYNNYGLTHSFKPAQTNTVNPQLSIVPDQATVTKGSWGTASIYLGDASTNINNINGLAFTVDFENTLIETNSIYIEYQNSFLDAGQNLYFRKLDFANSKIFTATTHTINNNVSGFGKIATLHYQIKSTLTTDQTLNLGISQANQSDVSGTIVPLTSGTGTLLAMASSVGLQELNGSLISISPNPTNGSLTINSKTESQKVEVVSITGQVLMSEIPTNVSHTLHLENLSNGIYFVNVYQNNRVVKREKIVLNK